MTRVCDIRELPTMTALYWWASQHGAVVEYAGVTLEGRAVYSATRGHVTRVARTEEPDPYLHPLVWHSPLEPVR